MNTSPARVRDTGRVIYKADVVRDAYSKLRISGLTVDPTPEDLDLSLTRLEDQMAMWETRNIIVGYNFEDEPDPNSITNVKAGYKSAMSSNLAVNLISDFNKNVPGTLLAEASATLDNISGRVAIQRLNQIPYPDRQPIGSGNSYRWNRWRRYYRDYTSPLNVNASESLFIGDVDDYVEQFDAYLDEGETIDTFEIQLDSGLELVSSSNTDDDVFYRIKANNPNNDSGDYPSQVTIIVTTSNARVTTRKIYFDIRSRDINNH